MNGNLHMNPRISICVPTYNRKDYLRETLDSIFAQTYKDYEVVVVDDGSTDGTDKMLEQGDYHVRYYRQENSGDAAARNKLIRLAQGEFITFIDSDDLLIHDAVERMVKVMEAESGEVIVYNALRNTHSCLKLSRNEAAVNKVPQTPDEFMEMDYDYYCGNMENIILSNRRRMWLTRMTGIALTIWSFWPGIEKMLSVSISWR